MCSRECIEDLMNVKKEKSFTKNADKNREALLQTKISVVRKKIVYGIYTVTMGQQGGKSDS